MVLSFFARLYSISVRHGEDDRFVWNPTKRGFFEVKSYYEVLNRKDGPYFRGRVSGVLRLQQGWLSLYGQQL
jgi:hypothetical protein